MAGSTKGDHGSAGNDRPKKGRQRVRRHWRPSLGRFIQTYDRRGEHARPKPHTARGSCAEGDAQDCPTSTAPSGSPNLLCWALVAGGTLIAVLAAIAALHLIGRQPQADYEILAAREPILVKINAGPARRVVLASTQERDQMVNDAARAVLDAARAHPDRLIVIDLESPPISFDSLSASDQQELRRELGSAAVDRYESGVAGILERVVDSVGGGRVSVLGLPFEPGEVGIDAARRTNRCYRRVLNRVDHLVSAHIFFRSDTWLSEDQMVQEALPEALHRRNGRPVVFRQNVTWRVVVDRSAADPERQAARRLVLADAGE